ncbi:MAG: hybrid sensor histidine kinase/response regulator [Acidobacteria bacterium]|nr:MAG: hybrid sensor histidine kinase/response regulator [Acidobacteriota bacterium]
MGNDDVKILIVDDEARNLDALEIMLEPTGCTPIRALSADEALLAMLRHEFAAMILDIRMPGMSGIELANLVKQRRRTQDVPILFLTAHLVEDDDVLRGYGVGAVDYLSKPIKADILRSKIAVFVELYRKTRALEALNERLAAEIAERQRAQEVIQQNNQELELRVAERTAALSLAHRGVKENEERLRMAMDVAQIAAWEWDVKTGKMTWSTDPEVLFGFPSGSFGENLRIFAALHGDDRERVEAAVDAAMSTGSMYECEYRAVRPDGVIVWITERGRVLDGEDGTVEKLVGVSRDVSAQRRAEHERERLLISERSARDEAERQSRLKDEFLATLSHELRTPMNAILGWLSMLAKGDAVRNPDQAMAAIQRNASIQAKLIEDLLEMNKLTSGTARLELAPTDLGEAVDSALQTLQPSADAKDVRLTVTVDPAVPPIQADERRVQQILWNLLHNAVKFTPVSGRVDVSVTRNGTSAQVLVKDTGQGIHADFLPFVFDRFRQADPSTTRGAWGLGIGLSIARHLVELHGGSIEAYSDGPGLGATFVVHLPISVPVAGLHHDRSGAAIGRPDGVPPSTERRARARLAVQEASVRCKT